MSFPFHVTTRAHRGIAAIVALSADVTTLSPEWPEAKPVSSNSGEGEERSLDLVASADAHWPPITTVTSYGNISDRWASIGRGGYVFITWKGDHPPRHVHVYRDGRLIVKWDLDNQKPMKGAATRRILELINELEAEGLL